MLPTTTPSTMKMTIAMRTTPMTSMTITPLTKTLTTPLTTAIMMPTTTISTRDAEAEALKLEQPLLL